MIKSITEFRHHLHALAELSAHESKTAEAVIAYCKQFKPDAIYTNLGGNGVILAYGDAKAPCVMLRGELDAVPINETIPLDYGSLDPNTSHKCGHDGHMAVLAGVASHLSTDPPEGLRVLLLFQPAEETGEGAGRVLRDRFFTDCTPAMVFSLHNVPGYETGKVLSRRGTICCASRGMSIELTGKTAHAAQPETGISPALPMARLIEYAMDLNSDTAMGPLCFATVVGAKLGEKAFGTSPGKAQLHITLRAETNERMAALIATLERQVELLASEHGLGYTIGYEDVFDATVNDNEAFAIIKTAAGPQFLQLEEPFRWSEDFGQYCSRFPGAMFGFGAGTHSPALHDQSYDFPDDLIPHGIHMFMEILKICSEELC